MHEPKKLGWAGPYLTNLNLPTSTCDPKRARLERLWTDLGLQTVYLFCNHLELVNRAKFLCVSVEKGGDKFDMQYPLNCVKQYTLRLKVTIDQVLCGPTKNKKEWC
ncbi:hypothetical protein AMTRI_Chr01g136290 [Amborella trichopoda]